MWFQSLTIYNTSVRIHSNLVNSLCQLCKFVRDLQTLLHNLHEEVSCSVCMSPFTDPKILPCFHTFCLHCLNELQRTSGKHGEISCPELAESFKFLEVNILKTCRPTFEWTVCWMSWLFKNATSMEWSVETATKQAPKVSIALNVAPSGATIASLLITLSEPIKTTKCWRLRILKIKTLKTCWNGQYFAKRNIMKTKS